MSQPSCLQQRRHVQRQPGWLAPKPWPSSPIPRTSGEALARGRPPALLAAAFISCYPLMAQMTPNSGGEWEGVAVRGDGGGGVERG